MEGCSCGERDVKEKSIFVTILLTPSHPGSSLFLFLHQEDVCMTKGFIVRDGILGENGLDTHDTSCAGSHGT